MERGSAYPQYMEGGKEDGDFQDKVKIIFFMSN